MEKYFILLAILIWGKVVINFFSSNAKRKKESAEVEYWRKKMLIEQEKIKNYESPYRVENNAVVIDVEV